MCVTCALSSHDKLKAISEKLLEVRMFRECVYGGGGVYLRQIGNCCLFVCLVFLVLQVSLLQLSGFLSSSSPSPSMVGCNLLLGHVTW